MTVHVSVRSISALLLLSVSLFGLFGDWRKYYDTVTLQPSTESDREK
jgi:hypothetical protein